ncbi:SDR family NAD(P)-dependent oxidoreductase [Streptomyces olivaceus]|uniref:SDR family NAD(P)-dependent oxidoreductase n=1 Tax=Streptomyces olivaceus TaxID=47716 RepID=UPI001CCE4448|nr:SDR family NAD(P)-dependent oxidoreductase [Streptomyces olivaceus]MBZ6198018.1 SDR family NAD(P)-dependent oxidoreductase [Streptomyces olivaceus]MBZ6204833.1 SDR family NAD(P)-dependent oxidoreductase [Streptomyces olivaceus]MBZ6309927.1 SDR family NAD(P)-dependent oxidoreductase [Streptomyces olivaceus]MBZ6323775.1 SDR family NAD(P)-dependent oxidoreductase [Streptomyces olivaceus]GHJ05576.1 hypothetical protein TPA0906_74410 [Streptomyces olivaceus]
MPGATAVDLGDASGRGPLVPGDASEPGPSLPGATVVWTRGDQVFAEVELPESEHEPAASFGIHPALLDAALRTAAFAPSALSEAAPTAFGDVVLRASGAARLRVALTRTGPDEFSVAAADGAGLPVLSIGSVTVRRTDSAPLPATGDRSVLAVEWAEITPQAGADLRDWLLTGPDAARFADLSAPGEERPVPQAVVLAVSGAADAVVESTHELTGRVLRLLQDWLADDRFAAVPLVLLTSGAVAAGPDEGVRDLAAAAVWGPVRSAQTENPGRFVLLDSDAEPDTASVRQVLASDEAQVVTRAGRTHAARLVRTEPGEHAVMHAGAGGVGLAAVQLGRHLGAEVYATASEDKRGVLHEWGVEEGRVASSRTLDFRDRFRAATDGRGVDVVLNSLAGEFVDASLDPLVPAGRFVEMGRSDIRSAADLRDRHADVSYQAFELTDAGFDRIQEMLRELVGLFGAGVLRPLPVRSWDVRGAQDAFRFMSRARHVGKLVLTVPRAPAPSGTVLITGAGALGGALARHLAAEHGIRHLLLVSRRGAAAPGAESLVTELAERGTTAAFAACDLTDREALAAVLAGVPADRPVTGVVHTAGVLEDGVLGSLSTDRLDRVLAPKTDAAWHLHELTRELDLSFFVVFSSLAGLLGSGGQANYAAGNAFLDALVRHRREQGLPAASMAWGAWTTEVGLVGTLSSSDVRRIERSALPPFSVAQGLDLFDRALRSSRLVLGLARLNVRALRARQDLPALWRSLGGAVPRRAADNTRDGRGGPGQRLAELTAEQREQVLTELVRESAAAVLGHGSGAQIDADRPFRELGFDSLTSVELRNLLRTRTGAVLAASVVFDYPTVTRLARHLADGFGAGQPAERTAVPAPTPASDDPIVLVGMACRFPGGVAGPDDLWQLVADGVTAFPADRGWDLDALVGTDGPGSGSSAAGEGGFLAGADSGETRKDSGGAGHRGGEAAGAGPRGQGVRGACPLIEPSGHRSTQPGTHTSCGVRGPATRRWSRSAVSTGC